MSKLNLLALHSRAKTIMIGEMLKPIMECNEGALALTFVYEGTFEGKTINWCHANKVNDPTVLTNTQFHYGPCMEDIEFFTHTVVIDLNHDRIQYSPSDYVIEITKGDKLVASIHPVTISKIDYNGESITVDNEMMNKYSGYLEGGDIALYDPVTLEPHG